MSVKVFFTQVCAYGTGSFQSQVLVVFLQIYSSLTLQGIV